VPATWSPAGPDGTDGHGRGVRDVQVWQGVLAGVTAGAAGGLSITVVITPALGVMMLIGPLIGAAAAGAGAALAAARPLPGRPNRSWMAGLFVSRS
jgi:hypothetical protein